jgi:hypothetical protein
VRYYRQALLLHDERNDGDASRIDLLIGLGTAERQAGDPEHRETLLMAGRLAQRRRDAQRLADAALANSNGSFSAFQGVDHERVAMLEVAVTQDVDETRRALLLATLANELTYSGELDRRLRLVDEALRAARATGDPRVVLRVVNATFHALWVPETLDQRLGLAEECRGILRTAEDPLQRFLGASMCLHTVIQGGIVEGTRDLLHDVVSLAHRLAQPSLQRRAGHVRACYELLRGATDQADAHSRVALDRGNQAGEPEAVAYYRAQQMCIHWQRGTLGELRANLAGHEKRPASAAASLCLTLADSGREVDALTLLDHRTGGAFTDIPKDPTFAATAAMFAEATVLLEHRRAAEALRELLAPWTGQVGFDGVTAVGSLGHYVGALERVLGRSDRAVEHLTRSAELHRSMGAGFFEARSRHERARALLARDRPGDRAEATVELRRAVEIAGARHHDGVRHRAEQALTSAAAGG